MIDFSYYHKIQNVYGTNNRREKELAKLNRQAHKHFEDTVDTVNVLKNGEPVELMIVRDTGTNTYRKKIKSRNGDPLRLGDMITWNHMQWMITVIDPGDQTFSTGTMRLCTILLSWQNSRGAIVRRWCFNENRLKPSPGIREDGILTVGDSKLRIQLALDDETKGLRRDKRFVIDAAGTDMPDTYKLTDRDAVTSNCDYFGRGGILNLTLSSDLFNQEKDRLVTLDTGETVWIADCIRSPTPPPPEPVKELILSKIEFAGNPRIIIGSGYKTFTAKFTDSSGNPLSGVTAKWRVTAADRDTLDCIHYIANNDNTIQIKADYSDSLPGKYVTLALSDGSDTSSSSIFVELGGGI